MKIRKIETNENKGLHWAESSLESVPAQDWMHMVNLYPDVQYQEIRGFGGAFTEASAHTYYRLSESNRNAIMEAYFGESGLHFNEGRIHMQSCDFGLGNYSYVEEGDKDLSTFSVERDEKEILPFIREAVAKADSIGESMEFIMAPWSPPAYMKTNNDMNHGGKLLPEYRGLWAKFYAKFIEEYRKRGVNLTAMTVQNEPEATQTWDSCIYTAEEEAAFIADYLGPELKKSGLSGMRIYLWDHNKEGAYNRIRKSLENEKVREFVKGAAVHWYTGDHFDAIDIMQKMYPGLEVIFTEGCVEYSRFADSNEVYKGEMYAHDILGNLKHGISTYYDWNLILDEKGGPNHVGNFCAAPIMADTEADCFEKRLTYFYIGHFSKFIRRGARRIGTTVHTDKLEVAGFLNPDGSRVLVALNTAEKDIPVCIREEGMGCEDVIAAHSIVTFVLE